MKASSSKIVSEYVLRSYSDAWAFMLACDEAGLKAGYPSLDHRNVVKVGIDLPGDEAKASQIWWKFHDRV